MRRAVHQPVSENKEGVPALAERRTQPAAKWQILTFHRSLQQLLDSGLNVPGMREGVLMLAERAKYLD